MRDLELRKIVLARQIPQHQGERVGSNEDILAIDLDADRGKDRRSSKMLSTKRRTRLVLPTPN